MKKIFKTVSIFTFFIITSANTSDAKSVGACHFNMKEYTFSGSDLEQAECLLRKVRKWGNVEGKSADLPKVLYERIGKPTADLDKSLEHYFTKQNIDENSIGGSLGTPLSRAANNSQNAPMANYFVIHDTSSPYLGKISDFPPDLDNSARVNKLSGYGGSESKAHIFVNRKGETLLGHDFSVPWRATKLELKAIGGKSKGLFLHIELVQPRREEPTGSKGNDAIAPQPGFSKHQYAKLAQLYAAASSRRGKWMIPAYHSVLDEGLKGAHDDPQNFVLADFANELEILLDAIK